MIVPGLVSRTAHRVSVLTNLSAPRSALERVGLSSLAARVPYHDAAHRDWTYKQRRMFDRLNPPITHYLTREALLEWLRGWAGVQVINADGQGWSARGVKP